MQDLAHQRCFQHGSREAVARCPECGRFFCRECVTEHEDRVVCASCLRRARLPVPRARTRFGGIRQAGGCVAGVLLLWVLFYGFGQLLLSLPDSFHEGTLWSDVMEAVE